MPESSIIHGPPPPPVERGWGGDRAPDGPGSSGSSRRASYIFLFLLIVASTVAFLAFTAALLMRRDLAANWVSLHKPRILWLNTVILLVSSWVLERARRTLHSGNRSEFNGWWTAGTVLGFLFLCGQAITWTQLQSAGFYMASNLSAAFFYILTASHAVHLLGGLAALVYVDVQALRFRLGPAKRTAIDVSAIFWHFLDGVWLYLMVVLYVWG